MYRINSKYVSNLFLSNKKRMERQGEGLKDVKTETALQRGFVVGDVVLTS